MSVLGMIFGFIFWLFFLFLLCLYYCNRTVQYYCLETPNSTTLDRILSAGRNDRQAARRNIQKALLMRSHYDCSQVSSRL